jgi:arginyl-tRNA synthetase
MSIQNLLDIPVKKAISEIFSIEIDSVEFQATKKEFDGDITLVVFPLLRHIKGNPATIGAQIGAYLKENCAFVTEFNVVKGFLNIEISNDYYIQAFTEIFPTENFGTPAPNASEKAIMVEYSSPNTNKPLHLGHIRNNLLGFSVAEILAGSGKKVFKTQIINDRGIHICKSMLAWQKFGNEETPEARV